LIDSGNRDLSPITHIFLLACGGSIDEMLGLYPSRRRDDRFTALACANRRAKQFADSPARDYAGR
jgi:hypothetical protein